MTPLQRLCAGAAVVLGLLAPAPLLANAYDGIDNDGDTQVDEADEHVGPDMGRLEQECIATARFEPCLASHAMFCEQLALPGACLLMDLGSNCLGGDPGQCRYYGDLMLAQTDCGRGNAASCQWLGSQPVWRSATQ